MVNAFSFRFDRSLAGLSLPPNVLQERRANEIKLAGLPVPAGLDPTADAAIRDPSRNRLYMDFEWSS